MIAYTCRRGLRMRASLSFVVLLCIIPAFAGEAVMTKNDRAHLVPTDKGISAAQLAELRRRGEQLVYTGAARTTIGMPCGGIAAGQLYVLGDGSLGCWQIDGDQYFSGVGHECYRTYRPAQPIAQGFALAVKDQKGSTSRATLDDDGYNAIEFVGEYPRALVRYRSSSRPTPPVEVDLEVFSPFVPLNARDSAWPATVLRFSVRNRTNQTLEVALGGWLQNMVFAEHPRPLTFQRRSRTTLGDGLTSVVLDAVETLPPTPAGPPITRVLANFESGTYAGWTVTGEAFGDKPSSGTHPHQQEVRAFVGDYLVNSYTDPGLDKPTGRMVSEPFRIDLPYLTFRIGGGSHEGQTCLNLVVDGQVVRTATGRDTERLRSRAWNVRDWLDREAHLEIVDAHSGPWGHVNVDEIALTNVLPDELREYDEDALGYGNLALSLVGAGDAHPHWNGKDAFVDALGETADESSYASADEPVVGTVATRFTLTPSASHDVTFVVSWYFPNLHTRNGRMYTNWFTDARDVAVRLARDLPLLRKRTLRFCERYYRETTLPWWLNTRLLMPVSNLATGTAQWWKNGRFWGWEGVGCCHGTCTHVWNYAQAHAWLFPELARSARSMQDLGEGFASTSGLVGFRSDRDFAADGQAGTVLKCYREHLTSPTPRFLETHWSRIKIALEYLISHDADENGIIENDRQHNTYDINFVGPNTFVGALYLAALRAGEEMASAMKDERAAKRYRRIFERGREWTAKNLFNGEYYEQRIPAGDDRPWQYGAGCLADQVFGQTWAHVLGLGYIYPQEQIRSALQAVFRYDWAPDVGPLNEQFPPERWFARPGEPGLFLCTWPRGNRPTEPVRYRDEIWTGIEYQVAAGLIWEGLVDEGLLIVRGIDQRYDGTHHNPWNEVECGDHYARALASWTVLHALAGFTFDGPSGRLTLAPRLQQDDFACFFCAGTGWGTLRQKRVDSHQISVVDVAWGGLCLSSLVLQAPQPVRFVAASVVPDGSPGGPGTPVSADGEQTELGFEVKLDQPVELTAGQRLEITLRY